MSTPWAGGVRTTCQRPLLPFGMIGAWSGNAQNRPMTEIRAFVGHSFTEHDEAVVDVFLKFFATVQNALSFSWVSALPAEPTELAAKVLKLLEDRNVFIAICTKKQRSIAPDQLSPTPFRRGFLKGRTEQFVWKTSDWIIQEIGLAIGRGLRIILLLETGVAKPGGLQGDVEYIEFSRHTPQACFTKILEMLTALLPKVTSPAAPIPDPRSAPAEDERTAEELQAADWWRPTPEWTQERYDFVLMHLIGTGDVEKLQILNEAYDKSGFKSDNDNAARWEALTAFYRLLMGTDGTIAQLRVLAAANPESAAVQEQFANGLVFIGEEQTAAREFEKAAAKTQTAEKQQMLLSQSARAFAKAKQDGESSRVIAKMRATAEDRPGLEPYILRTLAELSRERGDTSGSLPPLERLLELVPDDFDARFSLAYAHSQNSNDALALLHYTKIPERERGGATWNNLGVSSDAVGLPTRAVDAYRKAQNAKETLAMSNLASKFLKVGFLTEAVALCDEALRFENPHKNVGRTWTEAKELPDEENERLTKILAGATPISDFYRLLGRAEAKSQLDHLPPDWLAPEGAVTVEIKGSAFTAEGFYELHGLGGALGSTFGIAPAPSAVQKFRVAYRGTVRGRAIQGAVSRRPETAHFTRLAFCLLQAKCQEF